jgi:hypothetical protein
MTNAMPVFKKRVDVQASEVGKILHWYKLMKCHVLLFEIKLDGNITT